MRIFGLKHNIFPKCGACDYTGSIFFSNKYKLFNGVKENSKEDFYMNEDDERLIDETIEWLDEQIRKAESGEEAKKFAEAYKFKQEGDAKLLEAQTSLVEAEAEEFRITQQLDTEQKKNKLVFKATVIAAAVGAAITGGLKILGDLLFVEKIRKTENEDNIIVNTRKYKR